MLMVHQITSSEYYRVVCQNTIVEPIIILYFKTNICICDLAPTVGPINSINISLIMNVNKMFKCL